MQLPAVNQRQNEVPDGMRLHQMWKLLGSSRLDNEPADTPEPQTLHHNLCVAKHRACVWLHSSAGVWRANDGSHVDFPCVAKPAIGPAPKHNQVAGFYVKNPRSVLPSENK